jgi:16S rRNA (cytidine1402-2'-O)-methyltransferase
MTTPPSPHAPLHDTQPHDTASPQGTLYLVPTPLDFGCDEVPPITQALPLGTLQVAARLGHWVTENAKSTRAFLKRVGEVEALAQPLQALTIVELPREVHKKGDHTAGFDAAPLLQAALQGHDIGLVSEAGMPAIADPGASVVRAAHALGLNVVPLVGPVSMMLALAASGLNGQNFAFVGYLPQDATERLQRLKALETLAQRSGQTQLFIETPYRNAALWDALMKGLQPTTRVTRASGLTLPSMQVQTHTVKDWRQLASPPSALPTVFAIGV